MITIKSPREIDLMREAGRIVAQAHRAVSDIIRPGVSTAAIDRSVEASIRASGASPSFKGYNGFPASACVSINEEVVHGIPSDSILLKSGDIVKVDIGARYKGYHGDSAWTYAVGKISPEAQRLLDVTERALLEGLAHARAGARLSDISHAVQKTAEAEGMHVVRDFVGHGIGRELHEAPQILNYGPAGKGPVLKAGMTLAVEPMVNLGTHEVKMRDNHWTAVTKDGSLSAHFEHTILITQDACELLTARPKEV